MKCFIIHCNYSSAAPESSAIYRTLPLAHRPPSPRKCFLLFIAHAADAADHLTTLLGADHPITLLGVVLESKTMPLISSLGSFSNLRDLVSDEEDDQSRQNVEHSSGGRRPNKAHQPSLDIDDDDDAAATPCWLNPSPPSEVRLTVVQITDVYTLDNFSSLKTMLETIRERQGPNGAVISVLTGDFLSPYLLSSIDRGSGMMSALAKTPIDILIWGNHEADIDHKTVCRHVKNFPGIWINSNMQSHDMMAYQVPYHIVEVESADGTNVRKIGLVAVLSNDPKLYAHFKPPGAFGGAAIDDPWETLRKYKKFLEEEEGCDLVLPLEHLYVPEDHITCREFNFPVILSGHDHHRVDEIVDGTRLIKPGMDGAYATVLEVIYDNADQNGAEPRIRSRFVKTSTFKPCPVLKEQTDSAYDVLLPLRNTELVRVPSRFEPLSSVNARGAVTTMGQFICTLIKDSLNQQIQQRDGEQSIDACILMGGNIRGGEDYSANCSFFSLEMLEAEIKADEIVGIVPIPGHILAAGIESTHAGDPCPGWFQYDEGIVEEPTPDGSVRVTTVAGKPIELEKIYIVATKISDLGNSQSPPFKEYFSEHPELLPSKHAYFNIQTELMGFFARALFRKLWDAVGKEIQTTMKKVLSSPSLLAAAATDGEITKSPSLLAAAADAIPDSFVLPPAAVAEVIEDSPDVLNRVESGLRLDVLDQAGDGVVSIDEIHSALRDLLGLSVHEENKTLARYVHAYADVTGNGVVTTEDFEHFCRQLSGVGEYYSQFTSNDDDDRGRASSYCEEDEREGVMF